jgi:hypothetical protein
MTTAVLPGLNRLITGAASASYRIDPMRGPVNAMEGWLRERVLPVNLSAFTGAGFVALVALNWVADRSWYRHLGPLGAVLGWLSRFSILRRHWSADQRVNLVPRQPVAHSPSLWYGRLTPVEDLAR